MISLKQLKAVRDILDHAKRPFFLFDDDPDGFSAFLLLYRYVGEGRGESVKTKPHVTSAFVNRVRSYEPDVVFILDIHAVDQEFIDQVNVPVVWIDHHEVQQRERVLYLNPLQTGTAYVPTSAVCYAIVQDNLWIAMTGCLADYHIPPFVDEFRRLHPGLLPSHMAEAKDALYHSDVGTLVRVFSFNLKGPIQDVKRSISALMRITSPDEILQQSTARGAFVWKRYLDVNREFEVLKQKALATPAQDGVLLFNYETDTYSLTKDLSNYLVSTTPHALIIVCRLREGRYRCSLRSKEGIPLRSMVEKALVGIEGYGGGHEHACGASIVEADFERFLDNLRREKQFFEKETM